VDGDTHYTQDQTPFNAQNLHISLCRNSEVALTWYVKTVSDGETGTAFSSDSRPVYNTQLHHLIWQQPSFSTAPCLSADGHSKNGERRLSTRGRNCVRTTATSVGQTLELLELALSRRFLQFIASVISPCLAIYLLFFGIKTSQITNYVDIIVIFFMKFTFFAQTHACHVPCVSSPGSHRGVPGSTIGQSRRGVC
jgi:hypothetical protein